jgi:hypothetical protein
VKEKKFKLGPIQRAWVRALRSKKYKQTDGVLSKVENDEIVGHCCLGVLCQLALKNKVITRTSKTFEQDTECIVYGSECQRLPPKIQRWAGMRSKDGTLEADQSSLAKLNDEGMIFKEIADIIEKRGAEIFTRNV